MKKILLAVFVISLVSCRDPFNPPIISTNASYLVVEGVINTGPGQTSFRLSRTYKLADTVRLRPELNAQVLVEKDDNTNYPLVQAGNGYYRGTLNLPVTGNYRLRIKTSGGKEYVSEFAAAKVTPAIDSVGFRYETEGVRVYVNTDDPSNNTRYYRWEFTETWETRMFFVNRLKLVNWQPVQRTFPAEDVSTCWKYDTSRSILLGSTVQLQNDVVNEAPLTFISKRTEKLAVRYSILVNQYAIDSRAHEFFDQMKRNTETLGGFFDPQPSEIRGNITSVSDPGELVIGYVTASNVQQKRFFISNNELPGWGFVYNCPYRQMALNVDSVRLNYPEWIPFDDAIQYYDASSPACVDCTVTGGSTIRPSYW